MLDGFDNQFHGLTQLKGIVLLFFPGEREGNTYRFLGARTGWNYLATPILTEG